jgi:hypothetical protein
MALCLKAVRAKQEIEKAELSPKNFNYNRAEKLENFFIIQTKIDSIEIVKNQLKKEIIEDKNLKLQEKLDIFFNY